MLSCSVFILGQFWIHKWGKQRCKSTGWDFSLLLDSFNPSHFLYALMEKCIGQSDFWVAEEFSYKGFKRFSRDNSLARIAWLSIASRPYERDMDNNEFAPRFRELNYQTDAGRVPGLESGTLADKNRKIIVGVPNLLGHIPIDLWDHGVEMKFKAYRTWNSDYLLDVS